MYLLQVAVVFLVAMSFVSVSTSEQALKCMPKPFINLITINKHMRVCFSLQMFTMSQEGCSQKGLEVQLKMVEERKEQFTCQKCSGKGQLRRGCTRLPKPSDQEK
jgi:hypothetical protein